MADKEIPNLTAATVPLGGAEVLHLVQGGNSRKVTTNAFFRSMYALGTAIDDDDIDGSNALTLPADGNTFVMSGTQQVDSIVSAGVGTTVRFIHTSSRKFSYGGIGLLIPEGLDLYVVSGDSTEWMETSSGVWTLMKYLPAARPAFSAHSPAQTAATNEIGGWGITARNTGGNFNATTGRFTAHTDADYHFHFTILSLSGGTSAAAAFYKNGSSTGFSAGAQAPSGQRGFGSCATTIRLLKDDYVSVFMTIDSNLESPFCSFSGFML